MVSSKTINKLDGKLIEIINKKYRVVNVGIEITTLCLINDKESIQLEYISNSKLIELIENNMINICEEIQTIVDLDKLSSIEKAELQKYIKIMNEILEHYGEGLVLFKNKNHDNFIKDLSKKYETNEKNIRRHMIRYIKNGKTISSLIDQRKIVKTNKKASIYTKRTGRPNKSGLIEGIILTQKQYDEFDKIIKDFKQGHQSTITGAYMNLIDTYYSNFNPLTNKREWLPVTQRPTINQFSNYIHKIMTKADFEKQKTSYREFENNRRLLLSSAKHNVFKPGQVIEIDALEVDISIVSELDPTQCIGRPICYFMIDVLTSCIVSFSVSLENNSIIGLTNVMTNMADNKVELCNKYHINIDDSIFPSNFIPNEIRIDRGADFISDKFLEMCQNLGITINILPPGMGSMKPHVEQSFHQFQSTFRDKMERYGLITKRYDSNHHREAMLTLDAIREMVLNYIIYHNQHVIKDYKMSKDMLNIPNFIPTPCFLWKYYINKMGYPKPITDANKNQYIYNFLVKEKASLTRMGIKYKNLYYLSSDDELRHEMYQLENKRKPFEIKYDPRNVNHIYYMKNGQLFICYLNPDIPNNTSFKDITWKQYLEYFEKINKIKREGAKVNIEEKATLKNNYDEIINNNYRDTLSNDKNRIISELVDNQITDNEAIFKYLITTKFIKLNYFSLS